MKKLIPIVALFLLKLSVVWTAAVSTRNKQYCAYLVDKIYCYSGFNNDGYVITDMISLNVKNSTPTNVTTLLSSWETVTPINDLGKEGRHSSQIIASPDGTKMYVQGGYNVEGKPLNYPFLMYDAITNSWTSLPDFKQLDISNGLIRRGSVSYASSINKLLFYGGLLQHFENRTVTVDGVEVPTESSDLDMGYSFGFHNLTTFDMETKEWLQINNATNQDTENFIFGLTSIAVPGTNINYFFDGSTTTRTNVSEYYWLPLDSISEVRLPEYNWIKHQCTGAIPSKRDYHTSTLLPDKKTLLVYGGTYTDDIAVADYCYLLNLDTKVWTICPIQAPLGIKAPRFRHSAVLVGTHLFILFGKESGGNSLNDMLVLDISNIDDIKFVEQYAYGAAPNQDKSDGSASNGDKKGGGLGGGAIAGIVIGCIAVVINLF
ncbi:hypothetical protein BDB01DRAFT_768352 [Pilobolus umbonatus]|nr:hypothetical protein BDB01DRAFT_768352 [Pilobolus umbonatus]